MTIQYHKNFQKKYQKLPKKLQAKTRKAIFKKQGDNVIFVEIGSHSDLFG